MADHKWEKLNEYCESYNPECKNVKKIQWTKSLALCNFGQHKNVFHKI